MSHIERMHVEREELDEKLQKLTAFTGSNTFKSLSKLEQDLLLAQATAMATYSNILTMRINLCN